MGKSIALGLVCLFVAAPAAAGNLYRCVGADGISNYTSKKTASAACKVIAQSANARRSAYSRPMAAKVPAPVVAVATPVAGVATLADGSIVAPVVSAAAATVPAAPAVNGRQVVFHSAPAGSALQSVKQKPGARVLSGAVYRYERGGVTHYTNVRPRGAAQSKMLFSYVEACYACGALPGVNFGSLRLNTVAFTNEIQRAALQFGVEEAVVRAIIHAESSYRPNALSHAGAQGLMQLIPATAERFGVTDSTDATQNIKGGVAYLDWLMKHFNNDPLMVLAAYNAGEGAVEANSGVPPYTETRDYVPKVLAAWQVAQGLCLSPPELVSDPCVFKIISASNE